MIVATGDPVRQIQIIFCDQAGFIQYCVTSVITNLTEQVTLHENEQVYTSYKQY